MYFSIHCSHSIPTFLRSRSMNYFKGFDMVMNALDNRAARNHVNRMCLAADVPLIESGTAGYLGQVTLIKKGKRFSSLSRIFTDKSEIQEVNPPKTLAPPPPLQLQLLNK